MKRFLVHLTVWAMALAGVLASVMVPTAASAAPPAPGGYVSVTPTRLLDTRTGNGAPKAAVRANATLSLQVTGRGGVPANGVSAVVLNVTAVSPTSSGFITAYGAGARPTVSNLNFVAGQIVPNLVIVPVSSTGKVNLFNGSSGVTHMLADVAGYYRSGTPATSGAFGALTPTRLLDTRSGNGAPKARVAAGATLSLQVTGRGNVPAASGVSAVVLNVTAVSPTSSGFITAYGSGGRPTVSNLNFVARQIMPNLVIVPVSNTGVVKLFNGSSGTTDLLADVAGYYRSGAPVSTGAFGPVAPTRLLDTRSGNGAPKAAVAAGGTVALKVTGRGGVPATGVAAVVLNVTATQTTRPGFITAFGSGTRPVVSNLNFRAGQTVPNLVVVPVSATGTVTLFNGSPGTTQLLADVAGYYRSETGPVAALSVNGSTGASAQTSVGGFEPTFVVTGSTAGPNGTIASGSLNYGDGTTQSFTGPVAGWDPFHTFTTAATRTVTLTVTDSAGISDTDVVTVTVFAAPTATISSAGGNAGVPTSFDVSTTTPATTAFTDYEVDYGDGTGLQFFTGVPPAILGHTYDAAGQYTVTFSAFNDADGIVNASTQVTITQPPVTALSTTDVTDTSITLVWTNPINPAFTGVTIRRAVGATAPADPAAGDAVSIPASPTTVTFTDTGLTAGTTYSYAVFAHDAVPVNSIAATVTRSTTAPPGATPVAALSVNNSTGSTAKASLNGFPALFDLTGTQASLGQTIDTVTLDYGDGTTPAEFTGDDPSAWDANHEYATAGDKTVTLKVTDSGGGTATTVVTVTVFTQPSATITGPATSPTDAIARFNLAAVTPPGTAFTDWDISVDGIQVAFSGVGAPPATFDWQFDVAGTYTVTLSVFNDADGDAVSEAITLIVN